MEQWPLIISDFRKSSLRTAENYESVWAHSHAHSEHYSRGSFRISLLWPCWKPDPLLRKMHMCTQDTANNFKRVKKKNDLMLIQELRSRTPVTASRASFWAQNRVERFISRSEKLARGKTQGKDTDCKSERWNSQPYSEALLQQQSIHSALWPK